MSDSNVATVLFFAVLVLGSVVVARFHVWADVDERAHYAFVQTVAEDGRLPVIDDLVSPEVQAITDGTWPAPSPTDPTTAGLAGRNYEAFQPPLYYVAAAPATAVVGDHRDKVFALRAFDLVLYLVGGGILWLLAGRLATGPGRWAAWTAGLLVLAWPAMVVRGVTVSNTALEFALAPAFLLAAWAAFDSGSMRWLVAAALLLGLCLLTKLTLVVLGPTFLLALAAVRRERRSTPMVLAAAALPAAMLAPWLVANHARLGTWTANAAAREQQTPVLHPAGAPDWGMKNVPNRLAELLKGSLPQEWYGQLDVWWVGIAARLVVVAFVGVVIVAALRTDPAARRRIAFFVLPVLAGLALMTYTLLVEQWDIFLLRYLAPVLAPLAVAVAVGLSRSPPRYVRAGGAAVALVLALLWVDMAGAFLFTDVGDALGI